MQLVKLSRKYNLISLLLYKNRKKNIMFNTKKRQSYT